VIRETRQPRTGATRRLFSILGGGMATRLHAVFAAAFALALATSPALAQSLELPLIPESLAVPAERDVVAIPDQLETRLRERVLQNTASRERRLESLVKLLFNDAGYGLQYDGSLTRTVAQSAAEGRANCLSFSLLFVALARRAGIEAYVQETDHVLAWQGGDALYGNGHVNVGVKVGLARKTVDIDRSVVSIRGTPRPISDERALSHFYNNRGAELMREGQLDAARAHFDKALALTPEFVPALNNLGVLAMREGDYAHAGRAYAAALKKDARHAPTLSNMVNLYRRTGDSRRQHEFEARLFKVQRRDPFHQIILALGYEKSGAYDDAAEHYRRAIRLNARDHFVYFGLARAYAHLGESARATEALMRARDAAGDSRGMYQTKLDRLRHARPTLVR
jgi:tetratricopeptide (TPR) repeat protein